MARARASSTSEDLGPNDRISPSSISAIRSCSPAAVTPIAGFSANSPTTRSTDSRPPDIVNIKSGFAATSASSVMGFIPSQPNSSATSTPRYLLGTTVFRQDMQWRQLAGAGMMVAPARYGDLDTPARLQLVPLRVLCYHRPAPLAAL